MRKRLFLNFFFFSFALIIITTNTSQMALGLSSNNQKEIETKYIYTTPTTIKPLAIADKSNETELFLEATEVVEVFNSATIKIYLTESDIDLMAKVVFAESKGEPYDGKVAVASVILNRATNSKFPNTVEGVIKQRNAFSCVKNGVIDVVPDSDSYNAVKEAIRGNDPTGDALYFYNPKIATCSWMKGVEKCNVILIGAHEFFNVQ